MAQDTYTDDSSTEYHIDGDQQQEVPGRTDLPGVSNVDFRQQAENVAIGPGSQVHNHNLTAGEWISITDFFMRRMRRGEKYVSGMEDEREAQDPLMQKLADNFEFDAQNTLYVAGDLNGGEAKALQTAEEVTEWYYALSDYERCFVMAAVVLHGMQVEMVSRLAGELYRTVMPVQIPPAPAEEESLDQASTPEKPRRLSSITLQTNTCTTIRRVRGAARLYWQDTDGQGNSPLSMRILCMIADEASMAFGSSNESVFLEQLERWPELYKGEMLWRSARALGVVHWLSSVDKVRKQANAWANSDNRRHWQCAASYLAGIYESVQYVQERQEDDPRKSVIWLLNQWVQRAQTSANNKVGCTAAYTYRLIGRNEPEVALQGLDGLLYFEGSIQPYMKSLPDDVLTEGISHYYVLVEAGHIRSVLRHLAQNAQWLVQQRLPATKGSSLTPSCSLEEMRLQAFGSIFGLVSAASFSATKGVPVASYSVTTALPERPRLPDDQGRDILLAGLLAEKEPEWYDQLGTILATMILIGQESAAFLILHKWAELTLGGQVSETEEARKRLIGAIVNISSQILRLYQQSTHAGTRPIAIANLFRRELMNWQAEGRKAHHPIGSLALEIVNRLHF